MTRVGRLVSTCAVLAALSAALTAQTVDPKRVPGSWKPFPGSLSMPYQPPAWLTPAIVKELAAHLNEVSEAFHRTPFMASPIGWVMFQKAEVHFDRDWAHPTRTDPRYLVSARMRLWASHFESDGRTVYDVGSEFGLNFTANDLNCATNNAGAWAKDAEGAMFLEVEAPSESVQGFPRYQQCVLITHRPGPMFVPVALERVIKLRIAELDKRFASFREAMAMAKNAGAPPDQGLIDALAVHDQVLKDLRAKLAGLTADERRAPAFASGRDVLDGVLSFDAGQRIVEANPAFFDATRPSDIQVLTLFQDCVHDGCPDHPVVEKMIAQLDWKALAALVH